VGVAVVVGAGLAGLAAAHRLQSLGHRVIALEARERAGGKHAREALAGQDYEPWPGWLPRVAPAFSELSGELGLGAELARTPLVSALQLHDGRLRPAPLELRAALRRSWLAPFRLRRYAVLCHWLGSALDPDAPERENRLDDRSADDFCQVYLGRRAREELFAPLFAAVFGIDTRDASRQLLFALADAAGNPALDALSGAHALAEALAARLADLRTGARVASVAADRRGVRLESGETLRADALVLAVGAAEAARLLGALAPAEAAGFESLRARSGLVLAVATHKEIPLPQPLVFLAEREGGELAAIALRGPRLLQLVARPDLARRHGHRPDAELAHFLLESGARALPQLATDVAALRLHRFPGGRPAFAVGHYRALARVGACCAGDWCSAPHVEGELASGLRAARRIDRELSAP
jgi:oxygen-dependent protoporphyrinogen oxidase